MREDDGMTKANDAFGDRRERNSGSRDDLMVIPVL